MEGSSRLHVRAQVFEPTSRWTDLYFISVICKIINHFNIYILFSLKTRQFSQTKINFKHNVSVLLNLCQVIIYVVVKKRIWSILPSVNKMCVWGPKIHNTFWVIGTKLFYQIWWLMSLSKRSDPFAMHNI